ncbi:polyphenol oxidase family protein [Pseudomonas aeruginosa]|nr:polyphenol oxidase family protein [Pseudomonas aeruginosa]MCV4220389.1 polyphenol oxidase family protein [Pseudomonas aeruginosa]
MGSFPDRCRGAGGGPGGGGPPRGGGACAGGAFGRPALAPPAPEAAALFAPRPGLPGKWLADLPGLALLRLRRAGVQAQSCGLCTVQDSRFFSYRRDRETGRMALLAWLDAR